MALPGLFPLYPDPIPLKYQVSLALPPLPISKISQSIGVTASSSFLVPNVDFLQKFVNGDIGIADKMTKEAMFRTFNNPIAQKDEKIFKKFAEITNSNIPDVNKLKKNGKISLPKDQVSVSSFEGAGFKAFEKTLLTSIFETQKPYFEVAKLVIGNISKIEDIIARVMPLIGNPLITKSLKPVGNAGAGNRPKAIGYQGGAELKQALARLQKISKTGGKQVKIDRDGNAVREDISDKSTQGLTSSVYQGKSDDTNWEIVSAVYSTGRFIPGIDYKYTYIDLPPVKELPDETVELNLEDDDVYNKYKPEKIILGIFKSDGTPLDPREKVKTISLNSNGQIVFIDTPYNRADWILNSPKWQMENIFPNKKNITRNPIPSAFPSIGSPIYKWEKNIIFTEDSKTKPGDGWSIKKYKKDQKSLLDPNIDAIEDSPIIVGFDSLETNDYRNYFTDIVRYKLYQSEDLDQVEKNQYTNEIIGRLNVQSHLENVFLYGQNKSSIYKQINGKPAFPDNMRTVFKPFLMYSANAEGDLKLSAYNKAIGRPNGYIWIDPESDYETKVVRVDPISRVEFQEAKGQPKFQTKIKSFIKNKTIFQFSNNSQFTIELSKNGQAASIFTNVTSYTLENWNYYKENALGTDLPQIQNNNSYSVTIYNNNPDRTYSKTTYNRYKSNDKYIEVSKVNNVWIYKEYSIKKVFTQTSQSGQFSVPTFGYVEQIKEIPVANGKKTLDTGTIVEVQNNKIVRWYYLQQTFDKNDLPNFGRQITYNINYNGRPTNGNYPLSTISINIPQYQIKVENNDFPFGKIIDPSKILNEQLSTNELFSKGKYGIGDAENPQEIEIIKRYMLTDADTESYYIIEGVLTEKNKQTDNVPVGNNNNSAGSGSGSGYYRLPQAIGATKVFLSLLVDIVSKMIPLMAKIISLFKNPASFVTEILKEKMGEGFSIFSKESFNAFESAKRESEKSKRDKPSERERKTKDIFRNSPLSNHVFVDKKGDYKFLLDGVAMLPFSIFGLQIPFGMEMDFSKIPGSPINLIKSANSPKSKVKNMQEFLNSSLKEFKGPGSDGKAAGLNLSDLQSFKDDPIYKKAKSPASYSNPNDFEIIDIKYSTGSFINGVNYNYIYIDQDTENILKNAEDILNKDNEEVDLLKAQKSVEDLNDALKKDPNNSAIKDMLKRLKNKIRGLNDNTQPLLKMLLGLVTLPIKIIGGIIEWLMKFFKSLTNPLTLPSKIVELLSFSWLMKFFTPLGILELAGVVFKPEEILKWCALANIPNAKPPNVSPGIPQGVNLPELKYYKDASPKGRYLIPDDFEIADWSMALNMPFMPKLPTYTARQHREMCGRPIKLVLPMFCLFENVINGIIDFIWSILGIEALIPAPHIKLCSKSADPDINDAIKISNDLKKDTSDMEAGKIPNGNLAGDLPADAGFVYDITLDDGTVVKDLSYEDLQKYIKKHENIGYDFQF